MSGEGKVIRLGFANCARCGKHHELQCQPLRQTYFHTTHYAFCPTTGEPLLIETHWMEGLPAFKFEERDPSLPSVKR